MDERIRIIKARPVEGAVIERLMQQTIAEGAGADHQGQPQVIEAWSRSKQRAQIARWLCDPALHLNLGRWQGRPVATGLALRSGEICQCFVQPDYWRRGVGRALMGDLEQALRGWGCPRAMLYSTPSAVAFFERLGYAGNGPPLGFHGLRLQLMHKTL
ncbi:GNAT family N-acetyltransferase [Pseudomonas aegrilactucae]|uniref:GNAT family N-acetyltransferase n=1 Tax=Pseudomonas aegrilactucae TaxID=2854028 RepID=A0A9Q2XNX4_9PSED|nr:GNAT family N-acetyltransferase [Pseudomonas aegrilactucae]MBV6290333.1 GNAT family N-acetyltransferase [Pseudomonas aegrilactucae]